jgi:hypothetical protein
MFHYYQKYPRYQNFHSVPKYQKYPRCQNFQFALKYQRNPCYPMYPNFR